jgi:5-methylcytosine-specific restriction endonuclease McrA
MSVTSPRVIDASYPIIPRHQRVHRPKWRLPRWQRVERRVLDRDHHRCQMCGRYASIIDHVIPLCRGGTNDVDNFQVLCEPCNGRKAHWLPWELEAYGPA